MEQRIRFCTAPDVKPKSGSEPGQSPGSDPAAAWQNRKMNKLKRAATLFIAAALLALAGCASNSERQTSSSYFDDAAVTARVKTAIFNEPGLKVLDISVTTEDRVVHLVGTVKTRAERTKAGEVAGKVEGVRRVKNDLLLKPD